MQVNIVNDFQEIVFCKNKHTPYKRHLFCIIMMYKTLFENPFFMKIICFQFLEIDE